MTSQILSKIVRCIVLVCLLLTLATSLTGCITKDVVDIVVGLIRGYDGEWVSCTRYDPVTGNDVEGRRCELGGYHCPAADNVCR